MKRKHSALQKCNMILFFLVTLLSLSFQGYGQKDGVHKCYSVELDELNEKRYSNWKSERTAFEKNINQEILRNTASTIFKIPVVVHIIHSEINGAIQNANIPDQQVFDQIDVLNEDFRRTNADASNTPVIYNGIASDTEIEFCLADRAPDGSASTGINRIYTNKNPLIYPTDDSFLKGLSYWPSDQYLNIWVCRISDNSLTSKILGYAQFPSNSSLSGLNSNEGPATTDGVVVHYTVFGRNVSTDPNYNLGRTATHEVGHWLGLLHTWGDGDCSVDDQCNDTPNCDDQFFSSTPTCSAPVQCGNRRMIENYMDYSDDACMNLFTTDQKTRMQSALTVSPRRIALENSIGCCDTCTVNTKLNVYPNPASGIANLKIEFTSPTKVEVVIYDRIGQKVFENSYIATKRFNEPISVSGWADGLYIVILKADNTKHTWKLLVMK
jgi:Pregnancy-associated plasma protein-A/Secretion system C-terminal sorting domain